MENWFRERAVPAKNQFFICDVYKSFFSTEELLSALF